MMSLKLTIKVVAFFLGHPVYAHMYIVYGHFSETLTKTLTKLKGYKIKIPEWNAEHGDSNKRRHSTGSFESGFKTIGWTLLELEP